MTRDSIRIVKVSKFVSVLNELKPTGAKLLTYFVCTRRPFESFKMKYDELAEAIAIKNPHHAMQELIKKGYVVKEGRSIYHLNLNFGVRK